MDKYDVAIIGAGIAGASLALLLQQQGKKVAIFEKEKYPKHKVCGEFVSLESYDFFKSLGLPLDDWNLPIIKHLRLTSEKGTVLDTQMDIGGFGISRYMLDFELSKLMKERGIQLFSQTKVNKVEDDLIQFSDNAIQADIVIGSHGKYSPAYLNARPKPSQKNYLGVKYHIKGDFRSDQIALHSFEGGYCGMSKIENDTYCLCYLVDSEQLKKNKNDIKLLEQNTLFKNKHLKKIYNSAEFLWKKPLFISNVKFTKQGVSDKNILFCGDAAGSISPLSGNGMTIAARSALLLSQLIEKHTDFKHLKINYNSQWNKNFGDKIGKARILNSIMLNPATHDVVLRMLRLIKPLRSKVIREMQGDPFVRETNLIR